MSSNRTGSAQKKLSVSQNAIQGQPLTADFYSRPTLEVCADLLGQRLCRRIDQNTISTGIITEVEAYFGFNDQASHAFGSPAPADGKKATKPRRSDIMFGPAGHWYVYLCYGVHEMLNVVTDEKQFPAAILIRGLHDVSGPGRVTKKLHINRQLNGLKALPDSGLWVQETSVKMSRKDFIRTPRIGVDYAGPIWSKKPFRFVAQPDRLQKYLSQVII